MKLLSVFFLFSLVTLTASYEFKPCGSRSDRVNGECRHRNFIAVPNFSLCRNHDECYNGESCVVGKCQYECNPKCADGLACLRGVCVDGN